MELCYKGIQTEYKYSQNSDYDIFKKPNTNVRIVVNNTSVKKVHRFIICDVK